MRIPTFAILLIIVGGVTVVGVMIGGASATHIDDNVHHGGDVTTDGKLTTNGEIKVATNNANAILHANADGTGAAVIKVVDKGGNAFSFQILNGGIVYVERLSYRSFSLQIY